MTAVVRQLDVIALYQWLEQTKDRVPVLLDARERWETQHGVIKDSHCLPLSEVNEQKVFNRISKDEPVVAICHHGIRSAMVAEWLEHHGYARVFNLEGGIDAWARKIDRNIGIY